MDVILIVMAVPGKHIVCRYIYTCTRMGSANPSGPDHHPSEQEGPPDESKRDHDVAETIHLTEQNFDEALVATQGLVVHQPSASTKHHTQAHSAIRA